MNVKIISHVDPDTSARLRFLILFLLDRVTLDNSLCDNGRMLEIVFVPNIDFAFNKYMIPMDGEKRKILSSYLEDNVWTFSLFSNVRNPKIFISYEDRLQSIENWKTPVELSVYHELGHHVQVSLNKKFPLDDKDRDYNLEAEVFSDHFGLEYLMKLYYDFPRYTSYLPHPSCERWIKKIKEYTKEHAKKGCDFSQLATNFMEEVKWVQRFYEN